MLNKIYGWLKADEEAGKICSVTRWSENEIHVIGGKDDINYEIAESENKCIVKAEHFCGYCLKTFETAVEAYKYVLNTTFAELANDETYAEGWEEEI